MYAATRGPNLKWGTQISTGEAGHHWPPAGDGPGRKTYKSRNRLPKNHSGFRVSKSEDKGIKEEAVNHTQSLNKNKSFDDPSISNDRKRSSVSTLLLIRWVTIERVLTEVRPASYDLLSFSFAILSAILRFVWQIMARYKFLETNIKSSDTGVVTGRVWWVKSFWWVKKSRLNETEIPYICKL